MRPMGVFAVLVCCAITGAACSKAEGEIHGSPAAASPSAVPPVADGFTRVDPSQVCMVNDQFMGKPQIPVAVGGKTYFGCCAMCKQKLEDQPAARTGIDPVSGEPVDKASAVIVRDETNKVFYFADEGTLARFRR